MRNAQRRHPKRSWPTLSSAFVAFTVVTNPSKGFCSVMRHNDATVLLVIV